LAFVLIYTRSTETAYVRVISQAFVDERRATTVQSTDEHEWLLC